jgi:hypothetical protein
MRVENAILTRRSAVIGLLSVAGLSFAGCGRSATGGADETASTGNMAGEVRPAAMTIYRDPNCGCCLAWATIAQQAGFELEVVNHSDMPSIKRLHAVPDELWSCHTSVVAGYAIEGHVPMDDVKRLLAERPGDIKGIAVAGMPLGSPGMEVPDGTVQPFEVMAFDAKGAVRPYRG